MDPSALDKALSILESEILNLEHQSDALRFWLWFSTAIVVFGIFLELIVLIKEHREKIRDWKRATIRTPEKPSLWFFVFEVAATLLVFAGVAGELAVGVRSEDINTKLRDKNGKRFSLVQQKADSATNRAAALEREAGYLHKEAARLNKQAEDERVARVQMQALVSARHIPAKELQKLAASLSEFKGKELYLESYANDPESYGLGLSILTSLKSIPLVVWDHLGLVMAPGPVRTGVAVVGPETESKFVYAMSDAISRSGGLIVTTSDEAPPGSTVRVFIGIKPPFWFGTEQQ